MSIPKLTAWRVAGAIVFTALNIGGLAFTAGQSYANQRAINASVGKLCTKVEDLDQRMTRVEERLLALRDTRSTR